MRTSVAAIVVVGMVNGCMYGPYQFTCTDDASCGPGGKCEPNYKLCSFANPSCSSGRVFGDLGGAYAGQCVGSQPPPGQACYGTAPFRVCFATAPTGSLSISETTFDTDAGTTRSGTSLTCARSPTLISGGDGYCVLAAGDITITARLRATGSQPLVSVASGTLQIMYTGMIDVGSHRGQTPETGAGSDPSVACAAAAGEAPGNGGGGAGGSFLGRGGKGGNGNGAMAGGGTPGVVSAPPTVLRGGCPGQDGSSFLARDTGAGGHGGGAVFLIAGSSIGVDGTINAGGEGGGGGNQSGSDPSAGGGGGGAGGMIGLDAPNIMVTDTATLIANGGGGGEGNGSANPGSNGQDANMIGPAKGGEGTIGGNGGSGSSGLANGPGANVVVNATGGGGGGGGGAGFIKAPKTVSNGSNVSPAPTS